jgi:hypothetical protein
VAVHQNQDKVQWRIHLNQDKNKCRIHLNEDNISAGFVWIRVRIGGGFIWIRIGINDGFIWIRIRSVADSRELSNKPLVADSWVHGTQNCRFYTIRCLEVHGQQLDFQEGLCQMESVIYLFVFVSDTKI